MQPDAEPGSGQVVPGNHWGELVVHQIGAWSPTRRVSVVVPYYAPPSDRTVGHDVPERHALEITLAALAGQTYPPELVEVVVVDDGSAPPLELPARHMGLDVRVLHQEDRGFGLARARNTGAAAADGDILVFLDADMVAEPTHLEAHARWHHVCDHAVTLGFRRHVEFGAIGPDEVATAAREGDLAPLFEGRRVSHPEWIEKHLARTDELTSDHDDLFRVVTGGNLGVRAELFHAVGGFDETFTQWGSEDTDLGHRLFLAGAVLVPERRAACWHQGDSRGLEAHERASLDQQRARISQRITHDGFRRVAPGRSFEVPRVLVTIDVTDHAHAPVTATIESVLASRLHDLEVVVRVPADHPDRVRIAREWAGDPRVHDAEDHRHRRAAYRLSLPVGAVLEPGSLDAILAVMADPARPVGVLRIALVGVAASVEPEGDAVVCSTRALGRARLVGSADPIDDAARLFGARTIDGRELGIRLAEVLELARVRRPQTVQRALAEPAAAPPRTAAPAASAVGPWLLADSPLGWLTRGVAGALIDDADRRVAHAQHEAAVARYERDRLRSRRAVRLAVEVAGTSSPHDARTLPRRLRDATEAVPPPPAPEEPPAPAGLRRAGRARRAAEALDERGLLPPRPVRAAPFPHLRVLHLGVAGRFVGLAGHTTIDPDGWRDQLLDGADVLLIEPPADASAWDPLGGELPDLLEAARGAGIPSVRVGAGTMSGAGPGVAGLELVEGDPDARGGADDVQGAGEVITPSVDTSTFHPVGWRPDPPDPVVAVLHRRPDRIGRDLLAAFDPPVVLVHPPDLAPAAAAGSAIAAGSMATAGARGPDAVGIPRAVSSPAGLRRSLIRAGVLLDHPDWRGDDAERLRLWTAALACGTPVVAVDDSGGSGRRGNLPPGVVPAGADEAVEIVHRILVDTDLRERLGIVGRRWALRTGSRESALRRILDHLDVPVPPPMRTTVLLATNRPDFLERGLDSVARQTRAGVDVSLVLHGPGFDHVDVPERSGIVRSVVRAPGNWTLGDCLNAALDRATGELVAKMDDDDHYGPEHLWDLASAWEYSGADIVGKRVEYVHLAERGVTIRRPTSRPERDRPHVGGPTLLGSRETLLRHRFLRVPNRVDSTLYERVRADGGRVYGIHSRDFVLERHGRGHAWVADDDGFLADAIDHRDGLALGFASSDPDAPF